VPPRRWPSRVAPQRCYGVGVANRDSAGCGASTFSLQSSLPAGWAGTLSPPAMSLMPGASASTTLAVSSPATATAGTYPVSVHASHGADSALQASGSATYSVAAGTLVTSMSTNKTVYRRSDSVVMTAAVSAAGAPANKASVAFRIAKPNGAMVTVNATTNASGIASATYRLGRKDPLGNWQVQQTVTHQGSTAGSTVHFAVQ
jgi:uncharacterized protein YfaS (alpha-2-macroglobulin family)